MLVNSVKPVDNLKKTLFLNMKNILFFNIVIFYNCKNNTPHYITQIT